MRSKKVSSYLSFPDLGVEDCSANKGKPVWGPGSRSRLYNSTGFLFICWAAHYFPFWLMGRQRFLHHYLPAHLASVLVAGALVEFIFNIDPVHNRVPAVEVTEEDPSGKSKAAIPYGKYHFVAARERLGRQSYIAIWLATIVLMAATFWSFYVFAPLTYGTPGLDVEQVNSRKWLNYDLHFAK